MTSCFQRAALLFVVLVGAMALPTPGIAQDAEPGTRSRTETVGSLRCHVIRPIDAENNDLPPTGLLLGLPGPGVEADAFNRDLARAFGKPGEVVATPEMCVDDPAVHNAFRSADSVADGDVEDVMAVARVLTVRALQFLRDQKLIVGRVRVVAALGGATIAMQLLANGQLTADEVSLVLPDTDLPSLAGLADDGPHADVPVFDVYLDRLPAEELQAAESIIRMALGPAANGARFYTSPRGARSLGQYVADAAAIHRPVIIDTQRNAGMTVAQLVNALMAYDVIFYGEQHDSIATQQIEAAVFRGLHAKDPQTALSMEMFERDVQATVDQYVAGEIDEPAFRAASRPWPNYPQSYRAMIEHARTVKAPVLAANIPRSLARDISRGGAEVLDTMDILQRSYVARELHAELGGAYFSAFTDVMGAMAGHGGPDVNQMFVAQCAKDDTMAETIADFRAQNGNRRVLHVNGRFHSDHGLGTVERLLMRAPETKVAVISTEAVDNPLLANANDVEDGLARFVVFVPAGRGR